MENMLKKGLFVALCCTAMTWNGHAETLKQKYITYEEYGAIGDGVHDDFPAISAAHAAANEKGLPVKATDGKTYYIRTGQTAVIKTDTDFGTAKFIIDDVNIEDVRQTIFVVASDQEPFEVKGVSTLKAGQQEMGIKLPGNCLIDVINKDHNVYIRYGLNQNNGSPTQEVFVADKKGHIRERSQIVWNYDHITSMTAYPMDKKLLTVKGGEFTTIANQAPSTYNYHARGIIIRRSNVRVEGIKHYVKGELDHGAPYSGFVYAEYCADVVISGCTFTAHKTYSTIGSAKKPVSMGSYDIGARSAVNVLFEHCTQTTDIDNTRYWGLFGSNFCKDLKMDDCRFSRFDAHQGVANVTLTNCTFGHMGVRMVGFGTMYIEGCEVHLNSLVSLREDYGSSWEGNVIIKNTTLKPVRNYGSLSLLSGTNNGKHDFGYTCRLPYKMELENVVIDDSAITAESYKGPDIYGTFSRDTHQPNLIPFPTDGKVILRNVIVKSGKPLSISQNPDLFKGVEVVKE